MTNDHLHSTLLLLFISLLFLLCYLRMLFRVKKAQNLARDLHSEDEDQVPLHISVVRLILECRNNVEVQLILDSLQYFKCTRAFDQLSCISKICFKYNFTYTIS